MKDINNLTIVGRLTREPSMAYTNNGVCVAKFSIANDNTVKDKEDVNFFDVTAFKNTAEYIMKYIKKGYKVGIVGQLNQQRWTDPTGVNRSKIIILADGIEIMSSPQQPQASGPAGTQNVNQNPYAPGGVNPPPNPQQFQQKEEGSYGMLSSPPPQNNQPAPQNHQPQAAARPQTQNDGFSPGNPYSPQNWATNPANPNVQKGQLFDLPPDNNGSSPWDDGFYNDNIPF